MKTPDYVSLKTGGKTFYTKMFDEGDGNCYKQTKRVVTQVWNYTDKLGLALPSESEEGRYC